MTFVRGHRSSYDAWVTAGAKGWGFDDLGPASPGHPVAAAGLEAAAQAGYPRAADISGGLQEGFGWCDMNIAGGRRQSARDAYLTPALSRPNLHVVTGALVPGSGWRATAAPEWTTARAPACTSRAAP